MAPQSIWLAVLNSKPGFVNASVFMVVPGSRRDQGRIISPFIESQAQAIRNEGWDVTIGVIDDRTSLSGALRNVKRLMKETERAKTGVVHAQYGTITSAIASLIGGATPVIVSFGGDDLLGTPNPGWGWRLRERVARWIGLAGAGRARAIIVKSQNLLEALPAPMKRRAFIIPNGVDVEWFQPLDQEACRKTLGWPSRSRIVLFNASQDTNQAVKNPDLAIATMSLLSRLMPAVSLEQMSSASREDVRLMMNAADCLLVTSLHEGSPNVVKEAMACNLPVVSVPCGDVAERLNAVTPGAICPYDAVNLAGALQQVLQAGKRSNGREQLIGQKLTAPDVAARLIELYRLVQVESTDIRRVLS